MDIQDIKEINNWFQCRANRDENLIDMDFMMELKEVNSNCLVIDSNDEIISIMIDNNSKLFSIEYLGEDEFYVNLASHVRDWMLSMNADISATSSMISIINVLEFISKTANDIYLKMNEPDESDVDNEFGEDRHSYSQLISKDSNDFFTYLKKNKEIRESSNSESQRKRIRTNGMSSLFSDGADIYVLYKDLKYITSKSNDSFSIDIIDDNLYSWSVKYHSFEKESFQSQLLEIDDRYG